MIRIALITNHPPPFRIPIYEQIGNMAGVELQAVFCSAREPNRQWDVPPLRFNHVFLKERFVTRGSNFIHNNPDVIAVLHRLSPDVIITTGFNPTFLYAFAYAQLKGIPHIPMTDGTDSSERALSRMHRMIRRFVYSRSRAFLAASHGGLRLYQSYGVPASRCFQSCLCVDNGMYAQRAVSEEKKHDLVFCGRIVQEKNPLFALEVAEGVAERLGRRVSILFIGTGEQEEEVRAEAERKSSLVNVEFYGHATQEELPALYGSARIFLFPTAQDVWGVVANEACAAGLPVIVSPHAGVIGELVVNADNGFVCELDAARWIEHTALLLSDEALYQRFAQRSRALVSRYTFEHAAAGIIDACRFALTETKSGQPRASRNEAG
ncbi:MAG TPA: glycosyltransferase family 4 protein [Noviherbaspirillum sp.]|uniref:glycosyltransferase family 4 protein n=1 Tax=Noviherbaspirillum sp. TaxID=1926288 RepID=UPI002B48E1FD|nr:glycosyltransferase family 4 protein [Noviherbaspirillum sp.]HJV86996.1 glycosyltransferase family 4 protein [Noviherbaspirillum sp.]